ncbi:ABC transporter substrate-binding protein [Paenibacillus guangzhouensis]|uniref:ABC transporter substrate-binding protein n=1 Tax=Paenibacillus guangzhouensis TaxID=1473112 RepID=UPI00126747D4|nr:ABC transporter substrate-binding protein [Paenibacillus guangzhouensis]
MLPLERYAVLYDKYAMPIGKGAGVEVSLEQLAEVLYCTVRNVKLIIRRLEEEGWITWHAGRGRGNLSRITFQVDKDSLLLQLSQERAELGEYKQAFDMLYTYSDGTQTLSKFVDWLDAQCGYKTESWAGMSEADILRIPIHHRIQTLDPADLVYAFDSHMVRQLFDQLVTYHEEYQRFMPSIAHAWEHNEDASVWTFYLRKGVLFHDGNELTSEDIVFTLTRLKQCDKIQRWMLHTLEKVEAVGRYVVRVHLTKPHWLFLRILCSSSLSILPRDFGGLTEEEYWSLPIGTGPFRLREWNESQFVMEAYASYFQGRPHLDGVMLALVPREAAPRSKTNRWMELLYGQDSFHQEPDDAWTKVELLPRGCSLVVWNMRKQGPQRSIAFRRAMSAMIDRRKMLQEIGGYWVYPAHGFYPNEQTPHEGDPHDPDYARILLEESGYDGTPITLMTHDGHEHELRWIQQHCATYGVEVHIEIATAQSFRDLEVMHRVDGIMSCIVLAEDEVCLLEMYEQEGGYFKEFMLPEFQPWVRERLEQVLSTPDEAERRARLSAIERRVRDDGFMMFLLHNKVGTHSPPSVRGVGFNSLGWVNFKDVWVTKAI